MEQREKTTTTPTTGPGGGPTNQAVRQSGERLRHTSGLLAASRAAVDRTLSGNSVEFTQQMQQRSGE